MKMTHRIATMLSVGLLTACSSADTKLSTQAHATPTNSQILYWEVGPDRLTCHHPLMPNYQCLSVRSINYDSHTQLAQPTSDWTYYYGNIQGYEHTPGQGALLQIERQKREHVPADASQYLDTLQKVLRTAKGPVLATP